MDDVARLLQNQDGVVSRALLLDAGMSCTLARVPSASTRRCGRPRVQGGAGVTRTSSTSRSTEIAVSGVCREWWCTGCPASPIACRPTRHRRGAGRRAWLEAILRDVADGTCSVLEHGYQSRVVRPHGLPAGLLQVARPTSSGAVHRDVTYGELALVVELDGRVFHSALHDRDRDLDRDLDTAAEESSTTVRLGFGQVFARPCTTAEKLGVVMARQGWEGTPTRCPQCGTSDQPG